MKENGDEPIGTINVVHMNDEIDMVHIGYCIGRQWWHRGITPEAFKEIFVDLFQSVVPKAAHNIALKFALVLEDSQSAFLHWRKRIY